MPYWARGIETDVTINFSYNDRPKYYLISSRTRSSASSMANNKKNLGHVDGGDNDGHQADHDDEDDNNIASRCLCSSERFSSS